MGFPLALCVKTEPLRSKDSRVGIRNEMAAVHNLLIRGLNSMYDCAPRVVAGSPDVLSFCGYVRSWANLLHIHHTGEEEHFFPVVQEKLGAAEMADNIEQHRAVHQLHDDISAWLAETIVSPAAYSSASLRAILDEHAEAVAVHMHAELDTLDATKLTAAFEQKQFRKILDDWLATEIKKSHKTTALPFVVLHTDEALIPAPVAWIARHILYWWHSDYWKFCPYDRAGRPLTYPGPAGAKSE